MERFVNKYTRKRKKSEPIPAKSNVSRLGELRDYFSNLISSIGNNDSSQSTSHHMLRKQSGKIKNKDDNVEFGCMDLMKARAKRRAQKKAERLSR